MADTNNSSMSETSTNLVTKLKQQNQPPQTTIPKNIASDVVNCCLQRINDDQKDNDNQNYYQQHSSNGDIHANKLQQTANNVAKDDTTMSLSSSSPIEGQ